ncbi:HMG domain-containing 3-like protein [Labeo rohita]|uniref:HMG domain-containing 3-like protein n=1 Tax=Labeo rohita TaxID=84645 RepID=A0A498LG83_LABRO|nr:HMG domain-containing 3-like protein [Labeo rohita]
MDLILRLRSEMQNRHSYDKIFQKIWGASVVLCPHGVVYSLKFNLRAESPRDFVDLLLSWQHLPNVTIYDFARGLATHANFRVPSSLPFQPYEGRLADSTLENINKAKQGKLKVSLPWLIEKIDNPSSECHPITGSSKHYVLYDKLHESNTKDPKDVLRKISLVPELQVSDLKEPPSEFKGEVNTEEIWQSVDLEMIARGFVPSQTKNPFLVDPSYEKWAPWIGEKTRIGNTVLNTEYEKVASAKVTSPDAQVLNVSEDRLVDELMKQKVGVVRKLCKACNVYSKGSRMDLILRIRSEMQNRHSYNKIFQKIWGASAPHSTDKQISGLELEPEHESALKDSQHAAEDIGMLTEQVLQMVQAAILSANLMGPVLVMAPCYRNT